jgi:hypothetical protein
VDEEPSATIVTGLPCSRRAAVRANQWPVDKAAADTAHCGLPGRSAAVTRTVESASTSVAETVRETAEAKFIEKSPKAQRQPFARSC